MNTPRIVSWNASDPRMLDEAIAVLRRGALLVLPTDTVYGVAADPRVPGAEQKLFRAKGRSEHKPIALLAADCAQIERWQVRFDPSARALAQRYWPGALTMVLPAGNHPPSPVGSATNGHDREEPLGADGHDKQNRLRRVSHIGMSEGLHWEGFRIPNHTVALAVLRAAGGVLRVTSANRSGASPALTAGDAVEALRDWVDLALDAGPAPGERPSTVIQIGDGTLTILREGAIPGREILAAHRTFIQNQSG